MYKLIIVDDELKTLELMSRSINWEEYGFTVVKTFGSAQGAYDYVSQNPVDLIICDIYMPSISGIEFLKMLPNHDSAPLFIVLSAFREFEYAQEALRHGAFDFITKPVTEEKFSIALSRAKAVLDKSNTQSERNLSIKHMLIEGVIGKTLKDKSLIESMITKSDLIINNLSTPAVIIRASMADFQKYCADNSQIYSPQQFQNSIYNLIEMAHPNVVVYNYSYNFIYFAVVSPCKSYDEFIGFIKEKLDEISNTALEILNTEFVFDIYNVMDDIFEEQRIELTAEITTAVTDAIVQKSHSRLTDLCDRIVRNYGSSLGVNKFV